MLEARVVSSIHLIDPGDWDACHPGALENYDYLAAVEDAGLAGFEWRYVLVEEDGRLLAAAPAFFTDYDLDTTMTSFGRSLIGAARRIASRAFKLRLAALGSPCTEDVGFGFHPAVQEAIRPDVMAILIAAFEEAAAAADCWLLAIKDAPSGIGELWGALAPTAGYKPVPGMPSAALEITFPDIDGYLASLSAATRKDMRRKLKALAGLRIERRSDIAGIEERVLALYQQTRARSDMQFEDLTATYFTGVPARMGDRAFYMLYWAGDELLGANLLLQDRETLLDKFFCMETARGPAHNLYFVSWFTNVRLCLEAGLKRYRSGQAGYENKLRLGSWLAPTSMYFRHRRRIVNLALRWAAPMLAEDPVPMRGAA
jgi:hypothetical protein